MSDPIVIDPPDFDQKAAWKECSDYVESCGGLSHADGEPNMRAASGADPGICSCPACGEHYWAWGLRQRCVKCAFEYPTDWWPMYSWGSTAGKEDGIRNLFRHNQRIHHPYYRYGFDNPVEDPWERSQTPEFRAAVKTIEGARQ